MIWSYYIPNNGKHEGWGKFIIDSTGYFSCVTDYGNYAFWWAHFGDGDFREFLCSLDTHYIMGKFGRRDTLDSDTIIKNVRQHLLEGRREGRWDRDSVREWWDAVYGLDSEHEFEHFFISVARWKGEPVFCDWWEMLSKTYPCELQMLTQRLWPRFKEALKADLDVSPRVCKEAK